jgi:ABC-type multidrug transport system fused ATPase/permease subunit
VVSCGLVVSTCYTCQSLLSHCCSCLAGGQKQRVTLARAAYAPAQIVLLDDVLSAVDNTLSASVFQDCICTVMANRTRVRCIADNAVHVDS